MIAAKLQFGPSENGTKYLSGRLRYALERNALLVLKKNEADEWCLFAVTGDGRKIDTSRQSLLSFVLPDEPT